ncbi:MAG: NAD-dependent epimerase/dehydratase family protein [Kineosporiaceae bacterium]|nr:NAD-dependent epimerase/dehydratase family protein [Kineosporiaceae bacterium]
MKILLVGATGQVGYAVAGALTAAGHDLTVLVRSDRVAFGEDVRVHLAPEFTHEVFADALAGMDCAIYGVGLPEQYVLDETVFERVNRGVLATFLQALEASEVRRLTYISTYEVFAARDGLIRESHRLSDPSELSAYFRAMRLAYADALAFAERTGVRLTTIHPAALYGGLDTGYGLTSVIENLLARRVWRLPAVLPGRFPVIHAESLAAGIVSALDHEGAFLLSDGMCDLPTLAAELRRQAHSLAPPTLPAPLVYAAVLPLEAACRALGRRPILCRAQLDFITAGSEPRPERAIATLDWQPLPLREGLRRYLSDRRRLLAARTG